jgi:hypothetical protein
VPSRTHVDSASPPIRRASVGELWVGNVGLLVFQIVMKKSLIVTLLALLSGETQAAVAFPQPPNPGGGFHQPSCLPATPARDQ